MSYAKFLATYIIVEMRKRAEVASREIEEIRNSSFSRMRVNCQEVIDLALECLDKGVYSEEEVGKRIRSVQAAEAHFVSSTNQEFDRRLSEFRALLKSFEVGYRRTYGHDCP